MEIKNATVFKNNKKNLYEYSRVKFFYSIIYYKILQKPRIYKECIAKLQINDCFENFTHEPIVFAHFFMYLPNILII